MMAECEKRATRSSSRKKEKAGGADEAETCVKITQTSNKKKVVKDTHCSSSVKSDDKETALQVSQPCASKSEISLTTEDQQPKKVKSTRKKRPSEDDTEKENIKLSKSDLNTNDLSNGEDIGAKKTQIKSNDIDQVKSLEKGRQSAVDVSNIVPSESIKEVKNKQSNIEAFALTAPLPTTNFSKSIGMDLELSQKTASQPGAIIPVRSRNIYHQHFNSVLGKSLNQNSRVVTRKIANQLANYEVVDNDQPFKSRLTAIEWHPRKLNFLAVGSKHGDMAYYKIKPDDYSRLEIVKKYKGIGPGGNISSMKFHPTEDNLLYTSSLCGKVQLKDIEGRTDKILLDTMSWDFWFSALDVNQSDLTVCAGRNKGRAYLMDKYGELIWEKRLHTQKISHLEFSKQVPYLFCTASLDHTVRFWDVRKVQDKSPIDTLFHNHGLNSAYFSLTDGCRLLTTDQKHELRVYKGPLWTLEKAMIHPHRFFQHITPIKAYWHPSKDFILCGRYPDFKNLPQFDQTRCIDMFDVPSGELIGAIKDTLFDGIISLTRFNNEATKLVSAMGYNLNLWNNHATFETEDLSQEQLEKFKLSREKVLKVKARGRFGSWPRPDGKNRKDDDEGKKKKQATQTISTTRQPNNRTVAREQNAEQQEEEVQERGRSRQRQSSGLGWLSKLLRNYRNPKK